MDAKSALCFWFYFISKVTWLFSKDRILTRGSETFSLLLIPILQLFILSATSYEEQKKCQAS